MIKKLDDVSKKIVYKTLLAQIKMGSSSNKLKTKLDKYYIFCNNTIKSLTTI